MKRLKRDLVVWTKTKSLLISMLIATALFLKNLVIILNSRVSFTN
jgi:hypothetical protein